MIAFQNISGLTNERVSQMLGIVPSFLSERDQRPAREQINERYQHGGGWDPMPRWTFDPLSRRIKYPGDPALSPVAFAVLHGCEIIYCYEDAWFAIVQIESDACEISRLD